MFRAIIYLIIMIIKKKKIIGKIMGMSKEGGGSLALGCVRKYISP